LPITIVKLVVPPTAIVVLATVLLRLGVTTTVTVPGAVAVVLPRFVTAASGRQRHLCSCSRLRRRLTTIVTSPCRPGIVTLPVPSCRSG
jgi:hypothetical protein